MAVSLDELAQLDDAQLFDSARAVEDGAFERIYHHFRPRLVRYAERRGASDAEGVADLALFDGFRAFDDLQSADEVAFSSYVHRAARSHVIADQRRTSAPTVELNTHGDCVATAQNDPTDRLLIESLLPELTTDQRQVIECRFLLDMSAAATAEFLDKTPNAIDQLQHRAVRRLRRLVFSGAVVALLVVCIVILRQLGAAGGTVDRRPIDDPVETPERQEIQHVEAEGQLPSDPVIADVTVPPTTRAPQTTTREARSSSTSTAGHEPSTTVATAPNRATELTSPTPTVTTATHPATTAAITDPVMPSTTQVRPETGIVPGAAAKIARVEDKQARWQDRDPDKAASKAVKAERKIDKILDRAAGKTKDPKVEKTKK